MSQATMQVIPTRATCRNVSVLSAVVFSTAFVTGCAEDGPPRIYVSGEVTWQDQGIPSGYITFNPDSTKGNSGPQGVAWIRDGRFDTRWEKGRGASPGELVVTVYGFDGVNPSEEHPWGKPLFIPHKAPKTIDDSMSELTLTVPDSVAQYGNAR